MLQIGFAGDRLDRRTPCDREAGIRVGPFSRRTRKTSVVGKIAAKHRLQSTLRCEIVLEGYLATDREEVAMYGVLELLSAATATANAAVAEVAERYRQRPNTEIATVLTSVRTGAIARINEADFALSEFERAHRGPQPIGFT